MLNMSNGTMLSHPGRYLTNYQKLSPKKTMFSTYSVLGQPNMFCIVTLSDWFLIIQCVQQLEASFFTRYQNHSMLPQLIQCSMELKLECFYNIQLD